MQARYPRSTPQQQQRRTPRAVWRGSSTDPTHPLVEEGNALDLARSRLALLGRWYPGVLDAALVGWVQAAFQGQCVDELMPLGEAGWGRQGGGLPVRALVITPCLGLGMLLAEAWPKRIIVQMTSLLCLVQAAAAMQRFSPLQGHD
jgi:hypothetical protein